MKELKGKELEERRKKEKELLKLLDKQEQKFQETKNKPIQLKW